VRAMRWAVSAFPARTNGMRAFPHQFSGGMRQRVAIAIALLNKPDLIIADEPTTALDVTIQAQILHLMQQLVEEDGTGLVWITHDLSVVAGFADRVAVMYAGEIVEQATTDGCIDARRAPLHPRADRLRALAQRRGARLAQIPGGDPRR
jgi:peptide/nickel transport system ATP-binding protein